MKSGEPRVGAGVVPRFALFDADENTLSALSGEFSDILEPEVRTPFDASGLWLVRPDGYVALRANSGDEPTVQK